MPQRKTTKRVDASEVQGEGAYVEVAPLKNGEVTEAQRVGGATYEEQNAYSSELIQKHVKGWNWVDEAGNPLPLPSEDETVIADLTVEETVFLSKAIGGDPNGRSG